MVKIDPVQSLTSRIVWNPVFIAGNRMDEVRGKEASGRNEREVIVKAAKETKLVLTAEEYQKGGLGNLVAGVIMEANLAKPVKFSMIGVNDRFGESGKPWELIKAFGLSAEHIADRAVKILKK